MMWLLIAGQQFKLQKEKLYMIGRKTCGEEKGDTIAIDTELLDDKHALIKINDTSTVQLIDLQSVGGCCVNGERIAALQLVEFECSAQLTFGGSLEVKLQTKPNELNDSSGFHDDSLKNSTNIMGSPEATNNKPNTSLVKRALFLLPNAKENIGRRSDSFIVPATQMQTSHSFANDSDDMPSCSQNIDDSSKADDSDDFLIPETQEVVPAHLQRVTIEPKFTRLSPVCERPPKELWNSQTTSEPCSQIRISTQEFNEVDDNSRDSSSNLMTSLVIPRISHSPVLLSFGNESKRQHEQLDAADAEVNALSCSAHAISGTAAAASNRGADDGTPDIFDIPELAEQDKADDDERLNTCTPDLFDLPILGKPLTNKESVANSILEAGDYLDLLQTQPFRKEKPAAEEPPLFAMPTMPAERNKSTHNTTLSKTFISHIDAEGDEEDYIATQPFCAPNKARTSVDAMTNKVDDMQFAEEVSSKDDNIFPPLREQIPSDSVTSSDKENFLPQVKSIKPHLPEVTVEDELDLLPTQAFIPTKHLASLVSPIAESISKDKHALETFKMPEGSAKQATSSICSSTTSISHCLNNTLVGTPRIIAEMGDDLTAEVQKGTSSSSTSTMTCNDDNDNVMDIFEKQTKSSSLDDLLPHLKVVEQTPIRKLPSTQDFKQCFPLKTPKLYRNVRVNLKRYTMHSTTDLQESDDEPTKKLRKSNVRGSKEGEVQTLQSKCKLKQSNASRSELHDDDYFDLLPTQPFHAIEKQNPAIDAGGLALPTESDQTEGNNTSHANTFICHADVHSSSIDDAEDDIATQPFFAANKTTRQDKPNALKDDSASTSGNVSKKSHTVDTQKASKTREKRQTHKEADDSEKPEKRSLRSRDNECKKEAQAAEKSTKHSRKDAEKSDKGKASKPSKPVTIEAESTAVKGRTRDSRSKSKQPEKITQRKTTLKRAAKMEKETDKKTSERSSSRSAAREEAKHVAEKQEKLTHRGTTSRRAPTPMKPEKDKTKETLADTAAKNDDAKSHKIVKTKNDVDKQPSKSSRAKSKDAKSNSSRGAKSGSSNNTVDDQATKKVDANKRSGSRKAKTNASATDNESASSTVPARRNTRLASRLHSTEEPHESGGRAGSSGTLKKTSSSERGELNTTSHKSSNAELNRLPVAAPETAKVPTNKIKIATTMVDPQYLQQLLTHIGDFVTLVQDPAECKILIMDRGNRTFKFLVAMAKGIPICTSKWLETLKNTKCMVKPTPEQLFQEPKFERDFGFSVQASLVKSKGQKVLDGFVFLLTPSVIPKPEELKVIIQFAGGIAHTTDPDTLPSSAARVQKQKIFLISNGKDRCYWHKYRRDYPELRILASEAIMLCVMRQASIALWTDKYTLQ